MYIILKIITINKHSDGVALFEDIVFKNVKMANWRLSIKIFQVSNIAKSNNDFDDYPNLL